MSVRCRPGPLKYYVDGQEVEIVMTPKTHKPRVLFVRDVATRMCYVVESYKVTQERKL